MCTADVPCWFCSADSAHWFAPCPALRVPSDDDDEGEEDCRCAECGRDDGEGLLLECGCCLRGFHLHCLDPPLDDVPQVGRGEELMEHAMHGDGVCLA